VDPVRYFLLREVPFGGDGDFSRKGLVSRLNVELANDLGNLAQRTLSFIAKNAGGVVPARGALHEADYEILASVDALPGKVRDAVERLAFTEALEEIWKLIRAANAYIDHQAPWALRKSDPARMETVLRVLVDAIRTIGFLLQPFMPGAMAALLDQLGVAPEARQLAALETPLAEGTALPAPFGIFPRYIETAI
jgi:methionyl-tRNA synthetase